MKKILLIDDDLVSAKMTSSLLERQGFFCSILNQSDKAMELLKQIPVHHYRETEENDAVKEDNAGLSDREMEILKEMVSGKNYKAIGEKLFISPLTVRKHASNIYEKLHVNSRAQAVSIAHKKKWI